MRDVTEHELYATLHRLRGEKAMAQCGSTIQRLDTDIANIERELRRRATLVGHPHHGGEFGGGGG